MAFFPLLAEPDMEGQTRNLITHATPGPGQTVNNHTGRSKRCGSFPANRAESRAWNIVQCGSVVSRRLQEAETLGNRSANGSLPSDFQGANRGGDRIVTLVQGCLRAVVQAQTEPLLQQVPIGAFTVTTGVMSPKAIWG